MGTPVVSLDNYRRQTPDWSNDDLAEFSRAHLWLRRVGVDVEIDQGISDEGDRWLAFYLASSGDVIVHFAKIAGTYCIDAPALGCSIRGRHFRKLVTDLLQAHPSSTHRSTLGAISVHPGSILLGLLLACIGRMALHSSEAQAAELPMNRKTLLPPLTESETRVPRGGLFLPSATLEASVPALHPLVVGSPIWSDAFSPRYMSVGAEPVVASMVLFTPQHILPHLESVASFYDGSPQAFDFDGHIGGAGVPSALATQPPAAAAVMPTLDSSHGLPTFTYSEVAFSTAASKFPLALPYGSSVIPAIRADVESTVVSGGGSSPAQVITGTSGSASEPSATTSTSETGNAATTVSTNAQSGNSATQLDQAAALVASHTGGDQSHLASTPNSVIGQIATLLNLPGSASSVVTSSAAFGVGEHASTVASSTAGVAGSSGTTSVAAAGPAATSTPTLTLNLENNASTIDADIGQFIQNHPNYQIITIAHETILYDPADLNSLMNGNSVPVETFSFSDGSVVALVGVGPSHSLASST